MVMCSDKMGPNITCKDLPQTEYSHKVTFDLNDPKQETAYWDFIQRLHSNGRWVILPAEAQDYSPYFEITGQDVGLDVSGENHAKDA